ncbi:aminotransferase class IV [Sinorhizobium glycinis]|uniref:Probable branched-chain-amino-acid aminotransferase n=1 Tax=Sinorhizobium glycinis TaxID=1472378 RepID=A0A178XN57_9HYPH|nr:aminotransferase class IV [Sinorhizobium glycinis]OAP36634.1 aminotransferase class IV [Sinorhizobium glycinis]
MQNYQSAQGYSGDARNEDVLVYLNGAFVHRDEASVSVFDSGFVLGDGVWEGLRLVNGSLLSVDLHMDRLFEGARVISLDLGMTRGEVVAAIMETCARNGFADGAHVRLMVTRGRKATPNQDPRFTIGGPTMVIVAKLKAPRFNASDKGLTLFTSSYRCSTPDVFDLRLNSHSRLNLIQALIQAIAAGADEALMLDPLGFVASCNSTNFFIVRKGELWTSTGKYSFNGITRGRVLDLFSRHLGPARQLDFTLAQAYSADEAFLTGTLGGVTPVTRIDGHTIGAGTTGPLTRELTRIY